MKFSTLALGLVVATSGFIALSDSSKAATFTLNGVGSSVTVDTAQLYEFTFISSHGGYQSNFVSGGNTITEKAPGYDVDSDGNQIDEFRGSCAICSFVGTIKDNFSLDTVDPKLGEVSSVTNAKFDGTASLFTIVWDDQFGDKDFNDFEVQAKAVPVPVPAIVPGIALAAAFFGSKALKRNKKVANESVA